MSVILISIHKSLLILVEEDEKQNLSKKRRLSLVHARCHYMIVYKS